MAISPTCLFLATIAVTATPIGWTIASELFLPNAAESDPLASYLQPSIDLPALFQPTAPIYDMVSSSYSTAINRFVQFGAAPATTAWSILHEGVRLKDVGFWIFGIAWTALIWSFFGGVISRLTVTAIGREEPIDLVTATRDVGRKLTSYWSAPFYPLLGLALLAIAPLAAGWLMRSSAGMVVAVIISPLVLLAGVFMARLAIGLSFGWPLIWPALATEDSDAFDAVSRTFAYTYQRPLHLLFFAIVAIALGAACALIVGLFAETMLMLIAAAAERGIGGLAAPMERAPLSVIAKLVRLAAFSFVPSFFWCASAAIYLLMRLEVDEKEMDEVARSPVQALDQR